MSYRSGGYRSPFIGIGIVVGILAAVLLGLRGLAIIGNMTGFGVPTIQSVEKQLFSNAETGDLYRALKRTYPQDYAALTQDILRHLKAGETVPQVDRVISADLLEAARRNRKDVVQAPADSFTAYRHAEIKVVEMLRDTDPGLCATYVMKGEVQSPSLRAFQKTLIAFRIAGLEAGAGGRDHPAKRAITAPTQDDVRQLGRQMVANGTSEPMVEAFLDGTAVSRLSPLDQCLVGLSFYRAVDQLPAGKGDKIYAFLLSRA